MTSVFLSASFPSGERGAEVAPFHPSDIASAAAAVAEGALRSDAVLVFGGHPTISPIVLQIASMLGAGSRVVIYQSEHFADLITDEVHRLAAVEGATIRWTAGHSALDQSLQTLREEMFRQPLQAAFFIGGMSGIEDEYRMLHELQPSTIRFLVQGPGGKSAQIASEVAVDRADTEFIGELWPTAEPSTYVLAGRAYASLVLRALHQADVSGPYDSPDEV